MTLSFFIFMTDIIKSIIDRIKLFQKENEIYMIFESLSDEEKDLMKSALLMQKNFLELMGSNLNVEIRESEDSLLIKYVLNSEEEAREIFTNLKSFLELFYK